MNKTRRAGFTLVELLICIGIVVIIAAIAASLLMNALKVSYHTAAVKNIQTIHTAQASFFAASHRFAESLEELGRKELPPSLRDGRHSGYLFRLEGTPAGYAVYASPERPGKPAEASYYSDESQVIREAKPGPAGPESPPIE